MQFPRFLFRVKDRQIEEEARKMTSSFGITDVEIRRDDTIDTAWLEDNKAMKTTYGLEDIRAYFEAPPVGKASSAWRAAGSTDSRSPIPR